MAFDLCRIGQLLRETREKKGLTFDEVSNTLFIRKQAIGAIEAGDWDHLPHPVYVKGYVTQYATFLNILDLLKSEVASRENESPAEGRRHKQKKERALPRLEVGEKGGAGRSPLKGAVECHRSAIVEILTISGLAPGGGQAVASSMTVAQRAARQANKRRRATSGRIRDFPATSRGREKRVPGLPDAGHENAITGAQEGAKYGMRDVSTCRAISNRSARVSRFSIL